MVIYYTLVNYHLGVLKMKFFKLVNVDGIETIIELTVIDFKILTESSTFGFGEIVDEIEKNELSVYDNENMDIILIKQGFTIAEIKQAMRRLGK